MTEFSFEMTPQELAELERDQQLYLDSTTCECTGTKLSGDLMCAECAEAEAMEMSRDYEEEERHERLMKALPNGDYTASEMREYLS